jgi:tRNA (guanosine-2'-O-)-methyltransferase
MSIAWGAAVACGPALSSRLPEGSAIAPKNLASSAGVAIDTACVVSGVELCFNAVDDNCNGIIDEGCGLLSGPIQLTVAWGDAPVDLDLRLTVPSGETVSDETRSIKGFRLDRDCPAEAACGEQNYENLVATDEPPPGHYVVTVKLADPMGTIAPVKAVLSARIGSRNYRLRLQLEKVGDARLFSFDL